MSLWGHTWELIKYGYGSFFKDHDNFNGWTVSNVLTFVGIPIGVVICGCIFKYSISTDLISDILTILSIFLAITLGVIFIVPDKLSKRLEIDDSENETNKNDRKRYKNFCKLFIQRLSFVLILCVVVIILTILMKWLPKTFDILLSSFIIGFFILSILCILKLIVDIYQFLTKDLNEISKHHNDL